MLYAGLDLSRQKLVVHVLDEAGETVTTTWVPPTRRGLRGLVGQVALYGQDVTAVVESMTGGRFVHDELELAWLGRRAGRRGQGEGARAARGQDRQDRRPRARRACPARPRAGDLAARPGRPRGAREARFRLHLVKHRTALKNRIHATLITFGQPVPVSDLFGAAGRELLGRLELPEPWSTTLSRSLDLVDELDRRIVACERELRQLGADHPYVPLLVTLPGIGWVLAYTIASEIGDIGRFASPKRLAGYTGLCPRVYQSGETDRRGALTKTGPNTCAGRSSRRPRTLAPRALPRQVRTHQAPARQAAWRQDRSRRARSRARDGDLAHAHAPGAVPDGRPRTCSGRLTTPK